MQIQKVLLGGGGGGGWVVKGPGPRNRKKKLTNAAIYMYVSFTLYNS